MLPNALSIIRIILTVPIVIALLKGQYLLTILLFLLAGITDALDGWIAKQFSYQSRLGSILDPMADKILLTCTFVMSLLGWNFTTLVIVTYLCS